MLMKQIKKKYEKPQIEIFSLQNQAPLICTSGGGLGNPGDYDNGGNPFGF